MHCVVKSALSRRLAWLLSVALAVPYVGVLATPAAAQSRTGELASVALLTFDDLTVPAAERTGEPTWQARNATAAVAMALDSSGEYLVTPEFDVEREMKDLGLSGSLSPVEQVRLGQRLEVTYVGTGEVMALTVNPSNGSVAARVQIRLLKVGVGDCTEGAVVEVETPPRPGYEGDPTDAVNEALRVAAETGVAKMLAERVPDATIESVALWGQIRINVGHTEGMRAGMTLVVMRHVYLPEQETSVWRNIGRIRVVETYPTMSLCEGVGDVAPRTGDKAIRVYAPYVQQVKAERKKQARKTVTVLLAVGVVLGLVSLGQTSNEQTAPRGITFLHQAAMGEQPEIRYQFPKPDKFWGHLLFRGFTAGFPATAPWMVQASGNPNGQETISFMDDTAGEEPQQTLAINVTFLDLTAQPPEYANETVTLTWAHPSLEAGTTYWHRVSRVTDPAFPPGTGAPISTGGVTTAQANPQPNPDNEIDSTYEFPMISQPSAPAGPVTYILPPAPQSPTNGSDSQSTSELTFVWRQTTGADEYVVQVFPSNDPLGTGSPIFQSPPQRPTGTGNMNFTWNVSAGDLVSGTNYWWRVGARRASEVNTKSGQGVPVCGQGSTLVRGYVLSDMFGFTTAGEPPNPPSSSSASSSSAGHGSGPTAGTPTVRPAPIRGREPSRGSASPQVQPGARSGHSGRGSGTHSAPRPPRG